MSHSAVLELKDVTRRYLLPSNTVMALDTVNFSLSAGEFVAVTGPSGSGKTTLVMICSLLDRPNSGRVVFDGHDVDGLDEDGLCELRATSIGVIFQNYYLLPRRSVLENVLLRFRYLDSPRADLRETALRALDLVDMRELADRPAHLLSGGEMQRTAIARAIVVMPKLLAADEPTGNLDGAATQSVMTCLHRLNELGTAVLLVTHNESLIRDSDRRVRCRNGTISD